MGLFLVRSAGPDLEWTIAPFSSGVNHRLNVETRKAVHTREHIQRGSVYTQQQARQTDWWHKPALRLLLGRRGLSWWEKLQEFLGSPLCKGLDLGSGHLGCPSVLPWLRLPLGLPPSSSPPHTHIYICIRNHILSTSRSISVSTFPSVSISMPTFSLFCALLQLVF